MATAWAISRGLTQKLDYLQDLGVTAIWLLPFSPSPLKDDGYDIADYTDVHPAYGTLEDFQVFLREAHRRGLTRDHRGGNQSHFGSASLVPESKTRRAREQVARLLRLERRVREIQEARIIFKDFETSNWTWDPVAKAYYWHRFFSHQPGSELRQSAMSSRQCSTLLDFWLGMGVDGLRLDAMPYLYERRGTNCENLPETHAFLEDRFRAHVDAQI